MTLDTNKLWNMLDRKLKEIGKSAFNNYRKRDSFIKVTILVNNNRYSFKTTDPLLKNLKIAKIIRLSK